MKIYPLFPIILLLASAACAPQAEIVKMNTDVTEARDDAKTAKARVLEMQKRLDVLEANAKGTGDIQKVIADYGAKTDQLATDIQLLQGKLEENNFRIAELSQKLDDKTFKIAELSGKIDALEAKVKLLSAGTGTGQPGAVEKDKQSAPAMSEPSEAYRQAKTDYDKGNFDLALAGFQNYVSQFPETTLADKAQYWVGECYYAKKEFGKAVEAFSKVIKSYPKSDKAAGAKLKIGLSYLNEKNTAKAKEYLNKVIKEHPDTNEAEIAKDRLHKIAK